MSKRVAVFVSLLLALPALANSEPGRDPRSEGVRRALQETIPSEGIQISVVLREPEPESKPTPRRDRIRRRQDDVLTRLSRGGFHLRHRFRSLTGFSGWAQPEVIERLREHPYVESIYIDGRVKAALSQGGPLVGASTAHTWGVMGLGVTVAILDTGIDTNHANLSGAIVGEACFCDDDFRRNRGCCPDGDEDQTGSGSAEDDNGHGTAVAGIITSSQSSRPGIARQSDVVAVKVLDDNGSGNFSDIAAGLDWVIVEAANLGIRVVNISIGDATAHNNSAASPCSGSATATAIAELHTMDIPVFAASGNEAFSNGIAFPACTAKAISVGGSYDQDLGTVNWCGTPTCSPYLCTDVSPDEDDFVCHTNSGSLLDFVAPDWRTTTTTMGGGFGNFGGTSAASPYAAGMAALLIQADPTLGVEDIRTLLAMDAPMVSNPANGLSFPRARVDRALASVNVLCGDGFVDPGETCDDGNILAGDCCDSLCQSEPQGGACEDGDACTSGEACDISGVCQGGSTLTCDDENLCTTDSCDPASGCIFQNNNVACDDGNACTVLNICSGGFCAAGIPVSCDDAELCTDDSCDPGSGCVFTNNSAPCDDLSACTIADACSAGICEGGPDLDCDDGIYCTADSCDELTGCAHAQIADCTPPVITPGISPLGTGLLTLAMMGMAIRFFRSHLPGA